MMRHKILFLISFFLIAPFILPSCEEEEEDNNNSSDNNNLEMVSVSGGTFQMGCTSEQSNCNDDETPVHTVTVSDFKISKYEITNIQFVNFLNEVGVSSDGTHNGTKYIDIEAVDSHIEYKDGKFTVKDGKDNYPVFYVTWYGAKAFCEHHGGRLPTEAEWEFAARGGNNAKSYKFAGSNNIDEVAWYYDNCDNPRPVGEKNANELEIYDMTGNMSEWCSDWYKSDYYSNSEENNPEGPEAGTDRTIRGGCWDSLSENCHLSIRNSGTPDGVDKTWGFRLCKSDN